MEPGRENIAVEPGPSRGAGAEVYSCGAEPSEGAGAKGYSCGARAKQTEGGDTAVEPPGLIRLEEEIQSWSRGKQGNWGTRM